MKTLVTGANGFVAAHLMSQLLEKGYEVVGTVRSQKKAPTIFPEVTYREADLTKAEGWKEAMEGIDVVFHVASPLGGDNPNDPKLIDIAVAGVENVFAGAHQAGVKRIIMTSSQAACTPESSTRGVIDESFWTDPKNKEINAYRQSKLFAEKRAWELAKEYDMQLTTILPGAIFGPALTENKSSNAVIENIATQKAVPNINLEVTDVRDLATLHIIAMENAGTIGERIIAKNNDLTFAEVSEALGKHARKMPDFALKIAAAFIPSLRALTPMLGRQYTHTNQKAISYGWNPRDAKETVRDIFEK